MPAGQLRPHAGLARTDRPRRGGAEAPVHPTRRPRAPVVPTGRHHWEPRAMTNRLESVATSSGCEPLGRVAAPPGQESTSGTFYFWVDKERSVERNQIVRTCSDVGGRAV